MIDPGTGEHFTSNEYQAFADYICSYRKAKCLDAKMPGFKNRNA